MKIKESEKKPVLGPYLKTKKKQLWSMEETVPIVAGALGTVFKGFLKRLKELEIRKKSR